MLFNTIELDHGDDTTQTIIDLYIKTPKILIVLDEGTTVDYNLTISKCFHSLVKNLTSKLVITSKKFSFLSWQGLIKPETFELIVVRTKEVSKEFAHAFKVFYIRRNSQVSVRSFVKNVKTEDSCFLRSAFVDGRDIEVCNEISKEDNAFVHTKCLNASFVYSCIMLFPEYDLGIEEYLRLKILLQCEATHSEEITKVLAMLGDIEMVSYKLALDLLKKFINPSDKSYHFKVQLQVKEIEELLLNDAVFNAVRNLSMTCKTYLYSKNKSLLNYLENEVYDAQTLMTNNLDTYSDAILVFDDEVVSDYDMLGFRKVYLLKRGDMSVSSIRSVAHLICKSEFQEFPTEIPGFKTQNIANNQIYKGCDRFESTTYLKEPFAYLDYLNVSAHEIFIENTGATIDIAYSTQLLSHFLCTLKNLFNENFLYVRNFNIRYIYAKELLTKFTCSIRMPKIYDGEPFTSVCTSKTCASKKQAQREASFSILKLLIDNGLADDHLMPNKEKLVVSNKIYHSLIEEAYRPACIDLSMLPQFKEAFLQRFIKKSLQTRRYFNLLRSSCDERQSNASSNELIMQAAEKEFQKTFGIVFEEQETTIDVVSSVYRTQPECLTKYSRVMHLYALNDDSVGILSGESFTEKVKYKGIIIKYLGELELKPEHMEMILFYQVVFFAINFRRVLEESSNTRTYCYYIVPVEDGFIDFEAMKKMLDNFLICSVLDLMKSNSEGKLDGSEHGNSMSDPALRPETFGLDLLQDNILYEPFSKTFYAFHSRTTTSILDASGVDDQTTYAEYFENKYSITLTHKNNAPDLLFKGTLVSKGPTGVASTLCSEVMYVTSIPRNLLSQYKQFPFYFYAFESVCLAYELKKRHNLCVSTQMVSMALSARGDSHRQGDYDDYERLEFLGDSALKYITSIHLFVDSSIDLGKIVSTKDSIINNENLYRVALALEINRYFSLINYSLKLFQPPDITLSCMSEEISGKLAEFIDFFEARKIFRNNNQHVFANKYITKISESELAKLGHKTFADVLEALIGAHYLELGIEGAMDFVKQSSIIPKSFSLEIIDRDWCVFEGTLSLKEIEEIESIVCHVFNNKGWLEKAVTHPSFSTNIFGTDRFQKLELLGDCTIDICVTNFAYNAFKNLDPSGLHTKRKSFVNNRTLARVLFKTGLVEKVKTGFTLKEIEIARSKLSETNEKISKTFSDILEAIAGAVIVDCGFDLKKFSVFFEKLFPFIQACSCNI